MKGIDSARNQRGQTPLLVDGEPPRGTVLRSKGVHLRNAWQRPTELFGVGRPLHDPQLGTDEDQRIELGKRFLLTKGACE